MALQADVSYAIVNNVTGTVLEFIASDDPQDLGVVGCEWSGGLDQQWELLATGVADRWMIASLRIMRGANHILRPLTPPLGGAVGPGASLVAQSDERWQFFITAVTGGFTIRTNQNGNPADRGAAIFAVNIVPDDGVGNIFDDGSSVQLVPLAQAQVWSFVRPVDHPIKPGVYIIPNLLSDTVLGLSGNDDDGNLFVAGWKSNGGGHQKWRLTRNPTGFWRFQNVANHRFLTRELEVAPPAGTRLICVPRPQATYPFAIENVADTDGDRSPFAIGNVVKNEYRIMSAGLVLNLVDGAAIPPNNVIPIGENGAPAVLQNAVAQTWAIV